MVQLGLSLISVMVAVGISGIGIKSVMKMLSTSMEGG
jgi:Tfp pilus assembly protein PilV